MTEGLIIDDNRQTADALNQMLGVLDFNARLAYGSSAAMDVIGAGFKPDFIFLDINMPGVDGTEVLAYLRREPRMTDIPVIVVTSDDQPETREKVMGLGAAAVIIKPATIDSLEEVLKNINLLA
jgi:CheY-like chemotaxis protein